MNPYIYDLSSAFVSGGGTIMLPGGGSITIGGGTGYPTGPFTSYPYYGPPYTRIDTTTSGWVWIAALVLGTLLLYSLLK